MANNSKNRNAASTNFLSVEYFTSDASKYAVVAAMFFSDLRGALTIDVSNTLEQTETSL